MEHSRYEIRRCYSQAFVLGLACFWLMCGSTGEEASQIKVDFCSASIINRKVYVPCSVKRGINAFAHCIDPCQTPQSDPKLFSVFKFFACQRSTLHHVSASLVTK